MIIKESTYFELEAQCKDGTFVDVDMKFVTSVDAEEYAKENFNKGTEIKITMVHVSEIRENSFELEI